jgi:hypothetical protein
MENLYGLDQAELESFLKFLDMLIQGSTAQHNSRAEGRFGPERAGPVNLAWWRGRINGLQEAHDELVMRMDLQTLVLRAPE